MGGLSDILSFRQGLDYILNECFILNIHQFPVSRWTALYISTLWTTSLAADYQIFDVFTMPEVITLVELISFDLERVVKALMAFQQFENFAFDLFTDRGY